MNATVEDLRSTIIPKSDQLNAEQLLGGPITVTVTKVAVGGGEEQPVTVHYDGENGRPFKPCKTVRKVLIHAWGPNGNAWVGRSMTLFNDHSVKWAGEDVGGIRVSHLTDIPSDIKVSLTTTRGKKAKYEVKRLVSSLVTHLTEIAKAPTLDALKATFETAIRSTKVQSERDQLTAAKDKRKADLTNPAPTYSRFVDDINAASDRETATLALDEARDVLSPEQFEELTAHWKRRWPEVS